MKVKKDEENSFPSLIIDHDLRRITKLATAIAKATTRNLSHQRRIPTPATGGGPLGRGGRDLRRFMDIATFRSWTAKGEIVNFKWLNERKRQYFTVYGGNRNERMRSTL